MCLSLCDIIRYVEFIGTSCLDPEDETVKREMAEKVMKLLLQREGDAAAAAADSGTTGDVGDCTQGESVCRTGAGLHRCWMFVLTNMSW